MSKWTSTAGPRQTDAVNKAIRDLNWKGKTVRTLSGVIGGEERSHCSTMLFGPCSQACSDAMVAIGERFAWTVTRENCRAVEAAFRTAIEALEIATVDERRTPEQEAERIAENEKARIEREEKDRQRAADQALIVEELKSKYPWALPCGGMSSQARAAANLREELRRTFPGIRFKVTSHSFSGGNSVDVGWELGPTTNEVDSVARKYQYGWFDGMEDIYRDDDTALSGAVNIVLGQAKYVHCERSTPDAAYETVGRALCEAQGVEYRGNDTRNVYGENDGEYLSTRVNRILALQSFPPGAVLTGVEHNTDEGAHEPYRATFEVPAEMANMPVDDQQDERGVCDEAGAGATIRKNIDKGGIEIRFPDKPSPEVLTRLKSAGWRWSRFAKCWYAKDTPRAEAFARELTGEVVEV